MRNALIVFALVIALPAWPSALSNFSEKTNEEKKKDDTKESKQDSDESEITTSKSPTAWKDETKQSKEDNIAGKFLGAAYSLNFEVAYDAYPFAKRPAYYYWAFEKEPEKARESMFDNLEYFPKVKNWYILPELEYFHYDDATFSWNGGVRSRFFSTIGPAFFYKSIRDENDKLTIIEGGLEVAIAQLHFFSFSLYFGGSQFREALDISTSIVGIFADMTALKPFVLSFRAAKYTHDDISFVLYEPEIGIMLTRTEWFVSYSTLFSKTAALNAYGIGLRVWF